MTKQVIQQWLRNNTKGGTLDAYSGITFVATIGFHEDGSIHKATGFKETAEQDLNKALESFRVV